MHKIQRLLHHCHPQQKFGLSQILSGHFAYVKLHELCKGSLLLIGYMRQKEQFLNYSGASANLQTLLRGVHLVPCFNSLLLKLQGDEEYARLRIGLFQCVVAFVRSA